MRPKKPHMLMSDTKMDASLKPSASPICPMLFITHIPVPTPQRKDANRIQKSYVCIVCTTVRSSPITGFLFLSASSSLTIAVTASCFSIEDFWGASNGSLLLGCSVSELDFDLNRTTYKGTANGKARRKISATAKYKERTWPWFPVMSKANK